MRQLVAMLTAMFCWAIFCCRPVAAQNAFSLPGSSFTKHHTQARLLLSADIAKPGDTVWAGVDLKMEAGWHTYWKNPGDAGSPTKITWTLPSGITAGEIQWPLPEKIPPAEVTTYGYENEVVLLVPLTIASNAPAGPLDLKAKVSWLECKESCIPADQNVEATLTVGGETKSSAEATTIDAWKKSVPTASKDWTVNAWWEYATNNDTRPLIFSGKFSGILAGQLPDRFDFFPDASDNYEIQAAVEPISQGRDFSFRKLVKRYDKNWPKNISGILVLGSDRYPWLSNNVQGIEIKLAITDKAPATTTASIVAGQTSTSAQPLGRMLLFAFIGGLILNIMPCVLPVIALKILGFVNEAKSEPRHVRVLGLVYAVGVLVSFLSMAAVVIGVKAAGHQAGWGMQFGSPIFIVCLATLVTLVALNLFGVFEVTLGGRAFDSASQLASKHGKPGAFFNGVLATTLATPCTAPFLAPALGFAFSQNAGIIVLIFLAVGAGLASPYVLLSWNPAWLKLLPKPGAWMEKFKIGMGFPMLATVVWLYGIAGSSYGKNVLWLGVFLVIVALAAWIFGEFFQRGRKRRGFALGLVLILLGIGYIFALEKELNWRTAVPQAEGGSLKESADGIDWQPWSPEAVAAARAAGKPVLVDFTADWCLTCQVNKKTSIEIPSVRQKIKELGIVALLADDTHTPENISRELTKYNRAGVPLVLAYPKDANAAPIVLPEVLTPSVVLNALEQAAR